MNSIHDESYISTKISQLRYLHIVYFYHTNGSMFISIAEHGMFNSNFESTSGCKTPIFPITSP